mgnify:CR=1 FL=1
MDKRVTLHKTATFATYGKEADHDCNFNVHIKTSEMWDAESKQYVKSIKYARLFNSTFTYDKIFMNWDLLEQTIAHLRKYGVASRS